MSKRIETVYVAGPIGTNPGVHERVLRAIDVGEQVHRAGFRPFVPHLCFYWGLLHEHEYEEWMAYDDAWLRRCDAVLRMAGDSPGADREVRRAKDLGIPVFYRVEDIPRSPSVALEDLVRVDTAREGETE